MLSSTKDLESWLAAVANGRHADAVALLTNNGLSIDTVHPTRKTTALFEACRHGRTETTEWLLSHGATPSLQMGPDKVTSLHIAIMNGHIRCAELLLAYSANVTIADTLGRQALHHIITSEHDTLTDATRLSFIQQLLAYRAEIDAQDIEGATSLHYCAIYGRLDCARMLLDHGADPNSRTHECELTPCHIALVENNADLISLLIARGADPDLKTTQGWSVRSRYPHLCTPPGKQTAS